MTKKTILISTIFAAVMMFGLTNIVSAVGEEVVFSVNTPIPIYRQGTTSPTPPSDLVANAGGQVTSMIVDTDKVTLSLGANSDITFSSALGTIMSVSCKAGDTAYTAGMPSSMRVDYHADCTTVVLTIGPGILTEPNVAASPLTAGTASAYTVTFKTVNTLVAGNIIQLDFGSGFTVANNITDATKVTTFTDDTANISSGIALSTNSTTKQIKITLPTGRTIAAQSVVNIVLDSTLVTNPSVATADTAVSGIDIYTKTASGGTLIDSKENQTAYNRVIELAVGWNVFAPSQELENSARATVLTPISGSYNAIYTLAWSSSASTMTWQTPTTIDPLYGYAIYNNSGNIIKLPLDFAKETPSNGLYSRNLDHKGWQMVGYVGTGTEADAEDLGNCLDGIVTSSAYYYSQVVDLTGQLVGSAQTTHAITSSTTSQSAGIGTDMEFTKDYGYAINTTSDSLVLSGNRGLNIAAD